MKVRLPKHREFLIKFADDYPLEAQAWEELNQIVKDYCKDGKAFILLLLSRITRTR